jgi:hypothetical protein
MRQIISIIVILILLFFLTLLIQSSFIKETFISVKDLDDIKNYKGRLTLESYDTIDNPISDSLIPYNPKTKVELSEYDVIELTKSILERPPSIQEMKRFAYYTSDDLKEYLYNTPEYDKLIKTQDNHVNNGIEGAVAKKNLINRIMIIYSTITKKELPIKMMTPLRDCFIHLQLNEFLFSAMLESYNYAKFEVDVLSTYVLTKKVLLFLFEKHFNVLELKIIAQDKINAVNNKKVSFSSELENIKKDILSIGDSKIIDNIKNSFPNVFNEILNSTLTDDPGSETTSTKITTPNKTDIDLLNDYLKSIEKYTNNNQKDINNQIKELLTNTNNTNNTNNNQIKELLTNTNNNQKEKEKIEEKLTINTNTNNAIKKLPENSELYVRVYDPVKRNNSYILPDGYKAPICTTLGQDTLTQPVFTQSKLLFQGTDLNDAFEKSQIGSIMPKFIFKEYKDIKIN